MKFKLISKFKAKGDQLQAVKKLYRNLKKGEKYQVLLGVTGSGKTFTIASVIEKYQKPALIISPNKTLSAQLYQEFKEFFPYNSVHYFVSYYDYYQPEAYIPQTDTYIEKDAKINSEIDILRHAAVQDVLTKKDVIVVASVSCIYNIGSPKNYQNIALSIKAGQKISRKDFLNHLISLQYKRNDAEFPVGSFRVRGEIIEINLITGEKILRIEFNGNKIVKIYSALPGSSLKYKEIESDLVKIFPANFWITSEQKLKIAIENIRLELQERLKELKEKNKLVEYQRLEQRINYDLEMLAENGWCQGIENYSRQLEFRESGSPPFSLIDYFNYANENGFLIIIDESHMTIPQLKVMSIQDKVRKESLIEYGFRLPSAVDNRPLTFSEFEKKEKQSIYVSATPAEYEKLKAGKNIIEQIVRPTGLLEPLIEVKPTKNQIEDLIKEIEKETKKQHRILVISLTKRLAEEISDYLEENNIKAQYLHAEIKTMERPEILKDFRQGKFNVLVGVNLLREGLDLPEVSLVVILDADKEGFLRNKTTLIQTMGRAARHIEGRVILYGDKITKSMKEAIEEINRRRKIQEKYNKKHHIIPKAVQKEIRDWRKLDKEDSFFDFELMGELPFPKIKKILEKKMKEAAKKLDFETAAILRNKIEKLKKSNIANQ